MRKMKRAVIAVIALFTLGTVNAEVIKEGKHAVDAAKSTVNWKGEKVTGEHVGFINIKSGDLEIKDGQLVGGEFVIDMASIESTDLTGEYKGKLEGHLKSDDFFGVATYPIASLNITKVKATNKNGSYEVTADLTIKDITKSITFTTTLVNTEGLIYANSNIIIDRSEYDVKYGSGSFFDDLGDKTIYDDFTLTVNLVTK
jgi:polyisoprenoid-binding protein YceI